jgi:hypothetical protein
VSETPVAALDATALLRTLADHRVSFVVIGGLAVAAHGYVRATKDVDVVPRPDRENRQRLFLALEALGARPLELDDFGRRELPVAFDADALEGGGNWALVTAHGRIDIMQWVPGVDDYERLAERALAIEVPGAGAVLFAGYEDLIAMKRAADRPEDRLDLDRLARARDT